MWLNIEPNACVDLNYLFFTKLEEARKTMVQRLRSKVSRKADEDERKEDDDDSQTPGWDFFEPQEVVTSLQSDESLQGCLQCIRYQEVGNNYQEKLEHLRVMIRMLKKENKLQDGTIQSLNVNKEASESAIKIMNMYREEYDKIKKTVTELEKQKLEMEERNKETIERIEHQKQEYV